MEFAIYSLLKKTLQQSYVKFKNQSLISSEVRISLLILIIAFLAINLTTFLFTEYYSQRSFLESLLSNLNTMVFDIAIILCLTTWLINKSERRKEIQRYEDEIDDLRNWKSDEASHRIRGIIFRLNKLGVTKIDLYQCFLEGANLNDADLSGANLLGAECSNASLSEANLSRVILTQAILKGAKFYGTNLRDALLSDTNLFEADFTELHVYTIYRKKDDIGKITTVGKMNFPEAGGDADDLTFTENSISRANLSNANFRNANLTGVKNLSKATGLESADFTGAILDEETRQFLLPINKTVK